MTSMLSAHANEKEPEEADLDADLSANDFGAAPRRRLLLERHLDGHQHVEARAHRARADDARRRLAARRRLLLLLRRLMLRASDLLARALGLEPVAADLLLARFHRVMVQLGRTRAVGLYRHALRRREEQQVGRVLGRA